MFICAKCNRVVPPRTPANFVVSDVRRKEYPHRSNAIPVAGRGKKVIRRDDRGGVGWEAAATIKVCNDCLPAAQEAFEAEVEAVLAKPETPVTAENITEQA